MNRGKGDKERVVPVTSKVRSRVQECLSLRANVGMDDPLFVPNHRWRISARTVHHMLNQLGKEYHLHALRHTFVRGLVDTGIDLVTVAKLAGHTDLNITRSYATPSLENMREAMDYSMLRNNLMRIYHRPVYSRNHG